MAKSSVKITEDLILSKNLLILRGIILNSIYRK
ncbi:hypothetical protein BD809_103331 [Aquimarina intermedia]|uniref:Uncharacterized protein n=1 Tax=Aquimarina intermedia TaxID=350814 RepID=A0A5S5C7J2_9FLAO|nr:hypothetical protein BD809_103331 [Aquimarina intermedia]